ncbi:class I SAM-dependent methyltransferase [Luteimonas sp. 8-5]|uniref:class I SAM-dependent methyltransferase n=1 Tax=Luteimonas sp. 8-5 TaxID=3039387 RepID=UPI00243639AC|nr:class I SAM-dependent methyltransferase [Luteimonas sp. 8-5]MDG6349396.1 class I SAM-dependent methyltransferase [Luteimonas sp. 8-5]
MTIAAPTATLLDPAQAYALWAESYPPHAHNPVMLAEERAMLALLPASLHGLAVLDAGCGSGRYLLHALARGARHVTGVDLSAPMLARAAAAVGEAGNAGRVTLVQGNLDALPMPGGGADLSLCGLAIGHLPDLRRCLAELCRVTRPGARLLCSDFHPIGPALGWARSFRSGGTAYAVRHAQHLYGHWHDACKAVGLEIEDVREPMLDPADIAPGAHFDPLALQVPVALVLALRRVPHANRRRGR